jgi:hypothetical protein
MLVHASETGAVFMPLRPAEVVSAAAA